MPLRWRKLLELLCAQQFVCFNLWQSPADHRGRRMQNASACCTFAGGRGISVLSTARQGDDMRAYDMLTTMPTGFWEQPDRASRALFAGMIKHRQWSQVSCLKPG